MPPRSREPKRGPHEQLLFVGGPTLNQQSGNVRSTLLRRVLGEKRTKRRQDAADKLDSMLRKHEEGPALCSCSSVTERDAGSSSLDASGAVRYRVIMPSNNQDGLSGRCPTCGGILLAAQRAPSPQLLGAGRSDPLLPVDATAARLKVHELLDFAATTIWPTFRPLDYATNCYQAWVFPLENNLQLYAILWAASYHRDILRVTYGASVPTLESKEQLELKSLALKTLQMEVAKVSEMTSPDGLVMCILYLAVNDTRMTKITRDPSPFSPPFTNLQALDFYGSRDYHPLHWNVVQDIVRRFGGIENLHAYALAWLLSLSDLMNAVHSLRKPIYPVMGVNGKRLDLEPPDLLFQPHGHDESSNTLGSGFHELFYLWPPVKQEIVQVFIHLGQFSRVLQHYSREVCSPAVLDKLGDCRNFEHHRLLSLPNEDDPVELILECSDQTADQNEVSREIYLTCRLSAILYAVHVTFPIPRSQMLRQNLLGALCPRITRLCMWSISSPLVLWCVAVAVSVLGEGSPDPLISYMTRLSNDFGVDTVQKLTGLLRTFVWVDAAVDNSWKGMWARILPQS